MSLKYEPSLEPSGSPRCHMEIPDGILTVLQFETEFRLSPTAYWALLLHVLPDAIPKLLQFETVRRTRLLPKCFDTTSKDYIKIHDWTLST